MTDKEFKKLNRAQLIDIIYQLQLEIEKLNEEKQKLANELADKRIRLSNAGNIADAALEINNCFRSAQKAAEQYLNEIKAIREETEAEQQRIFKEIHRETEEEQQISLNETHGETEEEQQISLNETHGETEEEQQISLKETHGETKSTVLDTKNTQSDFDSVIEELMKEFNQNHSNNG